MNDPTVLQIRPYVLDDAGAVAEAVRESLPELQPWMPWCHPGYAIEESRAWLALQLAAFEQKSAFEFAIISPDGTYLGGCGANHVDGINRRANVGYWVRSTETGRGVATSALEALRDWAFANTDLVRLEIVVAVENSASHSVAEKAGATREGTLRRRMLLHGAAHDATMFSFTRAVPSTSIWDGS